MMINDNFNPQKIDSQKLKKLKGHVKLTLKDAETGEVQKVVEGDNIFTNALPDIITQCNYFGCMDYSQILPLWEKWFGGCLLYTDPFPVDEQTEEPDPNDYFIKNDSVNKVIAHAGDTFTSDIRDDPKRGMPNTYLQQRTPKSITMGWQWGPTQGNGQISAISLCHKDVGNVGTGSNSNAFKTIEPMIVANKSNLGVWPKNPYPYDTPRECWGFVDDTWCFRAWVGLENEEHQAYAGRDLAATTICFYRAGYKSVGMTDSNLNDKDEYYTTVYSVNWNWNSYYLSYWWDEENKNLWVFAGGQGHAPFHTNYFWGMKLPFIKNQNNKWSVDNNNVQRFNVYPNEDIIEITRTYHGSCLLHQYKILDDNTKQDVFYFPYWDSSRSQVDSRRWVKFNFQNQADYSVVKVNSDADPAELKGSIAGKTSDDIIVNPCWVMNSGTGYKCKDMFLTENTYSLYKAPRMTRTDSPAYFGLSAYYFPKNVICISKFLNITKFNLNDSVMKTASNTMELEYTITEVD